MSELGARLTRLRLGVGLDMDRCADLTGIDRVTLEQFGGGTRTPDFVEVAALAKVFGCFVSTILDRSEMLNRLEVATRMNDAAENDAVEVAEQLGFYLELEEKLDQAGIKAA